MRSVQCYIKHNANGHREMKVEACLYLICTQSTAQSFKKYKVFYSNRRMKRVRIKRLIEQIGI